MHERELVVNKYKLCLWYFSLPLPLYWLQSCVKMLDSYGLNVCVENFQVPHRKLILLLLIFRLHFPNINRSVMANRTDAIIHPRRKCGNNLHGLLPSSHTRACCVCVVCSSISLIYFIFLCVLFLFHYRLPHFD